MSAQASNSTVLLSDDIHLLGNILGKVIRKQAGIAIYDLVERTRALAKTRRQDDIASPEANVTFVKRSHLSRAARIYMSRAEHSDTYYRFDVVSILLPEKGKPRITIFRDAFREA